jgi:ATP/maltotriose-dependent transcriptional regulator MalT
LEEAEKLELQVMETRKAKLGADHPHTLTIMANLAWTYRSQGRWEDEEKLEIQVLETSKAKFGADHPDTLTGMANLASTYRGQGRWEEAEKLMVQVEETFARLNSGPTIPTRDEHGQTCRSCESAHPSAMIADRCRPRISFPYRVRS